MPGQWIVPPTAAIVEVPDKFGGPPTRIENVKVLFDTGAPDILFSPNKALAVVTIWNDISKTLSNAGLVAQPRDYGDHSVLHTNETVCTDTKMHRNLPVIHFYFQDKNTETYGKFKVFPEDYLYFDGQDCIVSIGQMNVQQNYLDVTIGMPFHYRNYVSYRFGPQNRPGGFSLVLAPKKVNAGSTCVVS